jgi:hypothetical protein
LDFNATGTGDVYPQNIIGPTLWLENNITDIIKTNNYDVYVDFQYSLYLSTLTDRFTWVDTLGSLNSLDNPLFTYGNKGSISKTRVGNDVYTQVNNTLLFNSKTTQMPLTTSNFQIQINLNSTINAISPLSPYFDIYIPGSNNFKITLTPSF